MIVEIKIPSPGESVTEVEIANWLVKDGDYVTKDQELAEVESDKATLPLIASEAGKIKILLESAKSVKVGLVACTIDTSSAAPENLKPDTEKPLTKTEPIVQEILTAEKVPETIVTSISGSIKTTPLAKKIMEENHLSVDDIIHGLQKITTKEVTHVIDGSKIKTPQTNQSERNIETQRMSPLRRKLSEKLVAAKNQTAMLTTFNEIDMSAIIELRKNNQKKFTEKYGIKLGYMSFFAKASALALKKFPGINSYLDGEQILTPQYVDIGIAVQTDKGLMVPVIQNIESYSIAELELRIAEIATKARVYKLTPEELSGGTFTITNGGVFGSLLSTPILNPPQSGILGLHKIQERPVALNGQVVIRPMMYVAVSYDHRIVDGRESVSFLATIKEFIESPIKLLTEDTDTDRLLLGL